MIYTTDNPADTNKILSDNDDVTNNSIYHIFSGKYSSFEYLIKCQMPTLYHTPTLYTLLFKYMIKCIRVITKLPNSEQSYKGKVKTHNYINRQNQSTTGKQ